MQIQLNTLAETQAFAAQLAGYVQLGDVITLKGTLGAGKSEFARAFIKTLAGQNTVVPSPTFTILEQYQTPSFLISHFDLYRLESPEELEELGFDEAIAGGVTLIEWPERLGNYALTQLLEIEFQADPMTEVRTVDLKAYGSWIEKFISMLIYK
jgi:tRNA threonylcarbamoyladenosine biosynthesis protein TsaE